MVSNTVGIDTVRLFLTDYRIPERCGLQPMPTAWLPARVRHRSKDHVLWGAGATRVKGAFAFYNGDGLHVQLSPFRPELRGARNLGCSVTFSVAKRHSGQNLHPPDQPGLCGVVDDVEHHLLELGIVANLSLAKVSRLDLFRNIELDEPWQAYRSLLLLIHPPRIKDVRLYPTGVMMKNTQRLIRIYDKIAEMRHRGVRLPEGDGRLNLLRAEISFRRARVVQKEAGIATVADLINGFDRLEEVYKEALSKVLLPHVRTQRRGIPVLPVGGVTEETVAQYFVAFGPGAIHRLQKDLGCRDLNNAINANKLIAIAGANLPAKGKSAVLSRLRRELWEVRYASAFATDPLLLTRQGELRAKLLNESVAGLTLLPVAPSPQLVEDASLSDESLPQALSA